MGASIKIQFIAKPDDLARIERLRSVSKCPVDDVISAALIAYERANIKFARPVTTHISAATVADLRDDVWRIVAIQAPLASDWDWTLTERDVLAFQKMRNDGRATSVQGMAGGQCVVFGKLAKYPPNTKK